MVEVTEQRSAFIALIGAPNAGKSTLTNALVGQKVSIVTPKVQTTRCRITGLAMDGVCQLVLVDTPGIFTPKKQLDKAMVRAAWEAVEGMDVVALLVDARKGVSDEVAAIIQGLKQHFANKEFHLITLINKVDAVKKESLLALAQELQEALPESRQIFMISALKKDGLDGLKSYFSESGRQGPWPYPEDQLSTLPSRLLAAEVTREKLTLALAQELPYQLMVETEQFEEKPPTKKSPNGSIKIHQCIYVARDSQKMIVLGKGGNMLKKVGEQARKELGWMFDQPVHLFLFVKVQENWQSRPEHYCTMGLEFG